MLLGNPKVKAMTDEKLTTYQTAPGHLRLTERFFSIEGEGVLIGSPTYLIRFASCNQRCQRCDTKFCVGQGTLVDCPRDLTRFPDGIPVEELIGRTNFPVYSYSRRKGRIVVARASQVVLTGSQESLYRVMYSWVQPHTRRQFSAFLDLTPEHRVMLRSGQYKRAVDLQPGDRLMPFFRWMDGYYARISLNNGENVHEHRFVVSERTPTRPLCRHDIAHHEDENPLNNSDENLIRTVWGEHQRIHWHKASSEAKALARVRRSLGSKLRWEKLHRPWTDYEMMLDLRRQNLSCEEIASRLGCSFATAQGWVARHGLNSLPGRHLRSVENHRVTSVMRLGRGPVFDLEVPGVHNFVANGVVVHNSSWWDADAVEVLANEVLADIAAQPAAEWVSFTGGEPFYRQPEELTTMSQLAKDIYHLGRKLKVETSGTILPPASFPSQVVFWSIAPKLPGGGMGGGTFLDPELLQHLLSRYVKLGHVKFVIGARAKDPTLATDFEQLKALSTLVPELTTGRLPVIFQPEGLTESSTEYLERCRLLVAAVLADIELMALFPSWRILPQWHQLLWRNERRR